MPLPPVLKVKTNRKERFDEYNKETFDVRHSLLLQISNRRRFLNHSILSRSFVIFLCVCLRLLRILWSGRLL